MDQEVCSGIVGSSLLQPHGQRARFSVQIIHGAIRSNLPTPASFHDEVGVDGFNSLLTYCPHGFINLPTVCPGLFFGYRQDMHNLPPNILSAPVPPHASQTIPHTPKRSNRTEPSDLSPPAQALKNLVPNVSSLSSVHPTPTPPPRCLTESTLTPKILDFFGRSAFSVLGV